MTFDKVPTAADERRCQLIARRQFGDRAWSLIFSEELHSMRQAALAVILSSCLTGAAAAQLAPPLNSRPQATPKIDTIPAPRDVAYPGTIQLTVDASDVTRGIFRVREHVPVPTPGDFVLLYPKWLPGNHSGSGQINKVAGLRATADGRTLD